MCEVVNCTITRQGGQYVHHVPLGRDRLVLVTAGHCVCVLHDTQLVRLKQLWRFTMPALRNLPLIEHNNLIIHIDKVKKFRNLTLIKFNQQCSEYEGETPMVVQHSDPAALHSLKLALEYAVLLGLPYTVTHT